MKRRLPHGSNRNGKHGRKSKKKIRTLSEVDSLKCEIASLLHKNLNLQKSNLKLSETVCDLKKELLEVREAAQDESNDKLLASLGLNEKGGDIQLVKVDGGRYEIREGK